MTLSKQWISNTFQNVSHFRLFFLLKKMHSYLERNKTHWRSLTRTQTGVHFLITAENKKLRKKKSNKWSMRPVFISLFSFIQFSLFSTTSHYSFLSQYSFPFQNTLFYFIDFYPTATLCRCLRIEDLICFTLLNFERVFCLFLR
jgi:hypothetical protein